MFSSHRHTCNHLQRYSHDVIGAGDAREIVSLAATTLEALFRVPRGFRRDGRALRFLGRLDLALGDLAAPDRARRARHFPGRRKLGAVDGRS